MPVNEDSSYYRLQGPFSDPGAHADLFAALPSDVARLCAVVRGLLVHDHFGLLLYGPPPERLRTASRATMPVRQRLDEILVLDGKELMHARNPFERPVGTCRDFALLLCAMLRHKAVPARVRCGFACYFRDERYEDHWLCEYWQADEGRWRMADPQLDEAHQAALSIDFDTAALPEGRFLPAWQAWRLCRSQAAEPALFGHGADRGAWLIAVNLARDLLALRKQEVSPWDSWRAARAEQRSLDQGAVAFFDRLADLAEGAGGLAPPDPVDAELRIRLDAPFWSAA